MINKKLCITLFLLLIATEIRPILDHVATKPVCNVASIIFMGLAAQQTSENSKKLASLSVPTDNLRSAHRCHNVIKSCNYGLYSYCAWRLVCGLRFCAPPTNITGSIAAAVAYKLTKYDARKIEKLEKIN